MTDVCLASWHLFDVVRIDQPQHKPLFQEVPDGLPINSSTCHRHMGDFLRGQPVTQRQQSSVIVPNVRIVLCGLPFGEGTITHATTVFL